MNRWLKREGERYRVSVARDMCLLALGIALGAVAVMLTAPRPASTRAAGGAPNIGMPSGVGSSSFETSVTHYRLGRERMNAAAALAHTDSWGCSWLTGGVDIEAVTEDGHAITLRSLSGALGPDGDPAAYAGGVTVTHSDGSVSVADVLVMEGDVAEMHGTPARVERGNGDEIYAPRFVRDGDLVSGDGRISARRLQGGIGGLEGETWIEADRFHGSESDTTFEGTVRAWSGPDLLTADALRVSGDRTWAVGSVAVSIRSRQPAVVEANRLEHDDSAAVFDGGVTFEAAGLTGTCGRLEVHTDADGAATGYLCTRAVDLSAPTRQIKRMTGEAVAYDALTGLLEVWGAPARIERAAGPPDTKPGAEVSARFETIEGPYIRYDSAGFGRAGDSP